MQVCACAGNLPTRHASSPPTSCPPRPPDQVKANPPLPSTRLAFLSVLLSLATLVTLHGIPFTLLRALRWYKARRRLQAAAGDVQLAEEGAGAAQGGAAPPAAKQPQQGQQVQQQGHHAGKRVQTGVSRRLQGLRQAHPRFFLVAFMAGLSIFSALSLTMITIAPSYVDPSIGGLHGLLCRAWGQCAAVGQRCLRSGGVCAAAACNACDRGRPSPCLHARACPVPPSHTCTDPTAPTPPPPHLQCNSSSSSLSS